MPSSTSAIGYSLDQVPDDDLASMMNLPRAQIAARRKTLAAQHADPAWVARTLDALPAATLAVLHLVLEGGGIVLEDELCRGADKRFGMSADDVHAAAVPAVERLLVLPLTTPHGEVGLGVVRSVAPQLAPLVAGLELLELPQGAFTADDDPVRNARTFLAVCLATRHLDIKVTNEGRPHRTATKRLAKQVGLDEAVIEEMLGTGLALDLLAVEGDVLRPDLAQLSEAAHGRYPFCGLLAASVAQLERGPLPVIELLAALLRRRELRVSYIGRASFDYLPGFATGAVGGERAVALRAVGGAAPAVEGTAAGHVTPSFEVMLPPESRLLDIVQVGACCVWERLDRAIVGRISKASVIRAVGGGSSVTEILSQLAAASRHAIPQNVEAAIRDWAGAALAATIAHGHVITVDAAAHDRVAPGLLALGARVLAPGVFLVDGDEADEAEAPRAIQAALSRAGALFRAAPAPRALIPADETVLPALSAEAARVRARVSAWRRNEAFEGKRDDFLELSRKVAEAETSALRRVEEQLGRWERAHDDALDHDDPAYHALLAILTSLPAETRARIFMTSKNLGDLVGALSKIGAGLARPGQKMSLPKRPAVPVVPRSSRQPARPPSLLWQDQDLRARLERAAEDVEALALQLPGAVRYVEIDRVMKRGNAWMVLGNDVSTGNSVAVKLDDVQAIAALPDDLEAYDLRTPETDPDELELDPDELADVAPRRPWHPAPGEAAPAGHLPCPCGSGARYRNCCRDLPRA